MPVTCRQSWRRFITKNRHKAPSLIKKNATDEKVGRRVDRQMTGARRLVSVRLANGVGALLFGVACCSWGAYAEQGPPAMTCTNPYSGAKWQIKIDYER